VTHFLVIFAVGVSTIAETHLHHLPLSVWRHAAVASVLTVASGAAEYSPSFGENQASSNFYGDLSAVRFEAPINY
jgi:hypothetical protein